MQKRGSPPVECYCISKTGKKCFIFQNEFSCLGTFHRSYFSFNNIVYITAEQFYQCGKATCFNDTKSAIAIMQAKSAFTCKSYGTTISNYSSEEWNSIAKDIVKKGIYEMMLQCQSSRNLLLSTGSCEILTSSKGDAYWCSVLCFDLVRNTVVDGFVDLRDASGKNELGNILMEVRLLLSHFYDT